MFAHVISYKIERPVSPHVIRERIGIVVNPSRCPFARKVPLPSRILPQNKKQQAG